VDEGRKRTVGVISAIFLCRKLALLEGKPSQERELAFRVSLALAEELMSKIDARWPGDRVQDKK
jgi:hypothetical protein